MTRKPKPPKPKDSSRRKGTPLLFTPELGAQIVGYIEGGQSIRYSAYRARLSPRTVDGWVKKGEALAEEIADGAKLDPQEIELANFAMDVARARATEQSEYIRNLREAASDVLGFGKAAGVTANKFLLSTRFRDDGFGEHLTVDNTVKQAPAEQPDLSKLSEEELDAWVALNKKLAG